uniref:BTB domain-containing protein n=1 Tax=Globodera rostochiensis TaxID=31243 RepID=A0A914HZ68_GLORO
MPANLFIQNFELNNKLLTMVNAFLLLISITVIQIKLVSSNDNIGQIELRLENFAEFASEAVGTKTKINLPKQIGGLCWQLNAITREANGKKYLDCFVVNRSLDQRWHCAAQVTFNVTVNEKNVFTHKSHQCYNIRQKSWSVHFEIEELLKKCQSCQSDVVILTANIMCDPASGKTILLIDPLLVKENGEHSGSQIAVNKKFLALHSPFFDKLFFGEQQNSSGNSMNFSPIIQLDPPETLAHFKEMINVLHGGESILNVQGKCSNYLIRCNCKMTKLKRLHIASKYGLRTTKNIILKSITREDFSDGKNFMENHSVMSQLSEEDNEELDNHYRHLFPESSKEDVNKKQKIVL